MSNNPSEILKSLSSIDQKIINDILSIERSRLHIDEIRKGSREEKEIVSEIVSIIDKAVKNDN